MKTSSPSAYRENPPSSLGINCESWTANGSPSAQMANVPWQAARPILELSGQLQEMNENLGDVILERIEMESSDIYLGAAELL